MFKFIQQYAEKIEGVQIYPIISLLIFLVFFIVLLWVVKTMDKKTIDILSNLPLDKKALTVEN